jgi:peptidoglycan/LPS O-acetylase OafA/YrhL
MTTTIERTLARGAQPGEVATGVADASLRTNNFDLIRLVAAMQVVVSHGAEFLGVEVWRPLMTGLGFLPGVPIFFVVSGFLISLSWERAPSARHYLRNRLLRIYPALWVCLLISIAIFLAAGVRPDSLRHVALWVAAQATVAQFYNPGFLRSFGVGVLNGSLWTIPVELQFYLVLSFLALLARKRPSRWLALTLVACGVMLLARTGIGAGERMWQKLLGVTIAPYLFYFLVGVLARYLFERRPALFTARRILAAMYAMWTLIELRFSIDGAQGNRLNLVSIVLIALLTVSLAFTARGLSTRVLRGNDISYGLYIYHMPVVNLLLARHLDGAGPFAVFVATAIALAALSWRFIERPALSLKDYSLRPAR